MTYADYKIIQLSDEDDVFLIGDIHGCKTLLQESLVKHCGLITTISKINDGEIQQYSLASDKKIFFTGDFCDKGSESIGVIQLLLSLIKQFPNQIDYVLGNHEIALLNYLNEIEETVIENISVLQKAVDEEIHAYQLKSLDLTRRQTAYLIKCGGEWAVDLLNVDKIAAEYDHARFIKELRCLNELSDNANAEATDQSDLKDKAQFILNILKRNYALLTEFKNDLSNRSLIILVDHANDNKSFILVHAGIPFETKNACISNIRNGIAMSQEQRKFCLNARPGIGQINSIVKRPQIKNYSISDANIFIVSGHNICVPTDYASQCIFIDNGAFAANEMLIYHWNSFTPFFVQAIDQAGRLDQKFILNYKNALLPDSTKTADQIHALINQHINTSHSDVTYQVVMNTVVRLLTPQQKLAMRLFCKTNGMDVVIARTPLEPDKWMEFFNNNPTQNIEEKTFSTSNSLDSFF